MADPKRLVEDPDASPLARSLLASADEDVPAPTRRAEVAKRLGIAAGLIAAGGGEVGAGTVVGAMWWKIGLIVIALGGAITGGVVMLREPEEAAPKVVAVEPERPRGAGAAAAEEPAAAAEEPEAAAPLPETAVPQPPAAAAVPQPPAAVPRPAPAPAPLPPAEPTPAEPEPAEPLPPPEVAAEPPPATPAIDARRLAAEVAVLDRARAALRRGDTVAATAALDEHAREFADGALVAEAELVRIETLIRAGQLEPARRRARDFLVRFPQSPLAKRLRSLVDRLPPAAKESP